MTKYIIRRLLWAIPVLVLVAIVVFVLIRAIPGGPFDFAGDKSLPPSVVRNLEAKYHLDWPVWQQFCAYLLGDKICTLGEVTEGGGLITFDLGPSFRYRSRSVNDIIASGLPISAQLGLLSMAIAVVPGILLGVAAALKQNSAIDYAATFVAILGASISNVVLGPALIFIFALELNWFPVARWGASAPFFLGVLPKPDGNFWLHAALPAVTLGSGLAATITRLTRASLLQVVREDYIRTARAKGLKERVVIMRHALEEQYDSRGDHSGAYVRCDSDGDIRSGAAIRHSWSGQALHHQRGQPRLSSGPGHHAAVRRGYRRGQPVRRHHLRLAGPADSLRLGSTRRINPDRHSD